jgi:hypothetical protein
MSQGIDHDASARNASGTAIGLVLRRRHLLHVFVLAVVLLSLTAALLG